MDIAKKLLLIIFALILTRCDKEDERRILTLHLEQVFVGTTEINIDGPITSNIPVDRAITLVFTSSVSRIAALGAITLSASGQAVAADISFTAADRSVTIYPQGTLKGNTTYTIDITDQLQGANGESFASKSVSFGTLMGNLRIISAIINNADILKSDDVRDVPLAFSTVINFSAPVTEDAVKGMSRITGPTEATFQVSLSNENKTAILTTTAPLRHLSQYQFTISNALKGAAGETFAGFSKSFYTTTTNEPQLPLIPDDALLTVVQQQTFKYFWDFAHPASGMARERNTSGDIVTSGGTGFGIMALIVGIERNFIQRAEGLERMKKILDFLETSDRFHGAWSHWLNGSTGDVVPFSANDNGGDLVETSFLVQGLITFRQYLNAGVPEEQQMISRINALWEGVEWDWYTREGQDVLYWHWSPDKAWAMNHQIKGYNECLITYVLAASSPTHSIDAVTYRKGWASDGTIANGKSFYNITLPLGFDYGGPLFFTHYSFLGLDPRNLQDTYGNYWTQNVNHSRINHAYSEANPKNFIGYSDENWGLTASDNHQGYSAHSPTNDLGVITPTAALSSFPYTPAESMKALKFFYYTLGDRLWGEYGFYDAFNLTQQWTASSYLAIDQGPIIVMIENHRTGLLWNLFMSAPEVQGGLDKLSFTY